MAGVGLCCAALARFVLTIWHNGLPWQQGQGIREHYVAVGSYFSQGFVVGFFLCFFLSIAALWIATSRRWSHPRGHAGLASDAPRSAATEPRLHGEGETLASAGPITEASRSAAPTRLNTA